MRAAFLAPVVLLLLHQAHRSPTPEATPVEESEPAIVASDTAGGAEESGAEESDAVDEEEAAGSSDPVVLTAIGRWHPMLVHVPIGWLFLLVLVDGATFFRRPAGPGWDRAGRLLLIATIAAALPAVVTGLVLVRETAAEDLPPALWHRNLIAGMFATLLLAALVRLRGGPLEGRRLLAYGVTMGIALLLLVAGAHAGATLVWGEGFLIPS